MKSLMEVLLQFQNEMYWGEHMAKVCKFCVRLNSFTCGDPDDCVDCGACRSKESKENG